MIDLGNRLYSLVPEFIANKAECILDFGYCLLRLNVGTRGGPSLRIGQGKGQSVILVLFLYGIAFQLLSGNHRLTRSALRKKRRRPPTINRPR